jgi:hypothetical protein
MKRVHALYRAAIVFSTNTVRMVRLGMRFTGHAICMRVEMHIRCWERDLKESDNVRPRSRGGIILKCNLNMMEMCELGSSGSRQESVTGS